MLSVEMRLMMLHTIQKISGSASVPNLSQIPFLENWLSSVHYVQLEEYGQG